MRESKLLSIGVCLLFFVISQALSPNAPTLLQDGLAWGGAVALSGVVIGLLAPRNAHLSLLLAVLLWLGVGAGVMESVVVVFWLTSAWSLGALALRWAGAMAKGQVCLTVPLLLGAALWLAIWGLMLHFPINFRWLHIVLCLIPVLLVGRDGAFYRTSLSQCLNNGFNWVRSIPMVFWVIGIGVVGWVLRWAWFPTMGYDDHALHLRVWSELVAQRRFSFDIEMQIWSVAPFALDLLHAGISLMAGGDARSALNLGLAILLFMLMARILKGCDAPSWSQWLLIVLMASTPVFGNLLLTLQTELLLSVLTLAGARLVMTATGDWRKKHILGLLACAALLVATKLPGLVLASMLFAMLLVRWWWMRGEVTVQCNRLRWTVVLLVVPLGFVALHFYMVAWTLTGNPVFPLYNAIFRSPFYALENFSDTRWVHGFSIQSYVRAFFHTSEFFETGDRTAGWQYLIVLPMALLGLCRPTVRNLKLMAIPLLGFGLVMFSVTQYWRYLFPAMSLAGIIMASLFVGRNYLAQAIGAVAALVCLTLNIYYFSATSWMMTSPPSMSMSVQDKDALTRMYAPGAMITSRLNVLSPGARVLYPTASPLGATLYGKPIYVNWYSPGRAATFSALTDVKAAGEFLHQANVDYVLLNMGDTSTSGAPEVILRALMADYGYVVAQEGSFVGYRVAELPLLYRDAFDMRAMMTAPSSSPALLLPVSEEGVTAVADSKVLAIFPSGGAKQARYSVAFQCSAESGYFVAQINWDVGAPYYRLISCAEKDVMFSEALPIPLGARQGIVYVTARDVSAVKVTNLSVQTH